jgi:hypothetical protein
MQEASTLSVKEYALLINKSDKTVYKMIKEGLIGAKKGSNGYVVLVDTYLTSRCKDINKNLSEMKALLQSFTKEISSLEKRVKNLESKSLKKTVVKKKLIKPLRKSVKKTVLKKRKIK